MPGITRKHVNPLKTVKIDSVVYWTGLVEPTTARLIQQTTYFSRTAYVINTWERYIYCLFCNAMATLKPTKTSRIMLRCNTCKVLVFANGIISQQRIKMLKDFIWTSTLISAWMISIECILVWLSIIDIRWCIDRDEQFQVLTLVTVHVLVSPSFKVPTQTAEKLNVY